MVYQGESKSLTQGIERRGNSIEFKYWPTLNILFTYLYTQYSSKKRISEVIVSRGSCQITPLHVCFAIIKSYTTPYKLYTTPFKLPTNGSSMCLFYGEIFQHYKEY